MVKWEYRQEIFQGVELLNKWGLEGWEIAGFFGKDGAFMVLKRQLKGRSVMAAGAEAAAQPTAAASSGSASSSSRSSSSSSRSSSGGAPAGAKPGFKEMI